MVYRPVKEKERTVHSRWTDLPGPDVVVATSRGRLVASVKMLMFPGDSAQVTGPECIETVIHVPDGFTGNSPAKRWSMDWLEEGDYLVLTLDNAPLYPLVKSHFWTFFGNLSECRGGIPEGDVRVLCWVKASSTTFNSKALPVGVEIEFQQYLKPKGT